MSLFGYVVKKGIELNQALGAESESAIVQQKRQLRRLLETAKNTSFGKYYGFTNMLASDDVYFTYKNELPIVDYHQMSEDWWSRQQIYPDITWPGKPDFFALSSGTTGKTSKRLPITKEFLQSMKDVGRSLIKELPNFDFPEALFESEVLMLSSSANLSKSENGYLEGEISGINVNNFPGWYDLFYRPGLEIASIPNWDQRIQRIAEEALSWNIGAVAGIPSWVLLMLQKVIAYHHAKSIHDIWPNFSVYVSGGVAFETYRADFEAISGRPISIIDTYLASEGFFAFTARPDTMDMRMALDHGYFYEFVPFDERGVDSSGTLLEDPEIFAIDQVELNQAYVLIISSCAGAWRYQIGDVIQFTKLDPPEIKITGRTKFFLNVVGSQLSEEKMDEAILSASEKLNVLVNEYMVAGMKNGDGDFIHQWVVVCDKSPDENEFARALDESLSALNKNYRVARSKALKGIEVVVISKMKYHAYLGEEKKKGGQVKTPKVMPAETMKKLLQFIR